MTSPEQASPAPPSPDEATEPAAGAPLATPGQDVADGIEHPLDPRSVTVNRIGAGIFMLPLVGGGLTGVAGAIVSTPLPLWARGLLGLIGLLALAGFCGLAYRWPEIEHRHTRYRVDARGIEIRRGVVWRRVINVPRQRVQHTDVAQGPLERHFGLGTLIIFTAGTDHAKVDLPGLDHRRALAIRDHLLPEEGSDAV